SYLSELLCEKGYEVHGLVRSKKGLDGLSAQRGLSSASQHGNTAHLHFAELTDTTRIRRLIRDIQPDELYHLAGQSDVGASFEIAESTCELSGMATLRLLEILRDCDQPPRLMHMSSSEVFGKATSFPQNENTPFRPVTPYGVAKAFATDMVRVYRDTHGLYGVNLICYNHESPRRADSFVSRKITKAVARIALGLDQHLELGNIDGKRDWGFARDFVRAMWLSLQLETPDDFVVATGQLRGVRDWLTVAFEQVNLSWAEYVKTDSCHARKAEPADLVGDATKIREATGWSHETTFDEMVGEMVRADMSKLRGMVPMSPEVLRPEQLRA
ncbi:MAG: GDP-mannose 4,6-dehydratase, partial [Planctomycetales bacterium]